MIKNNEIKEKIIKLFKEERRTPKSLSEEFDIPLPTIYVWIREGRKERIENDKTRIVKLFSEENRSIDSLSEEFGIPTSVIFNWIKDPKLEKTDEQKQMITEYLNKTGIIGTSEEIQNYKNIIKELQEKITGLEENNKYLREYINLLKKQLEEK